MICAILIKCEDNTVDDPLRNLINFDHLDHLTERVETEAGDFAIVHIYAEHPSYEWTDAADEGIACVDDVARAAVVHLMHYDFARDAGSLARAKPLLEFLIFMQSEDGEFYNFIDSDYGINKNGTTSRKSFNFWAVRAYWALAYGYTIYSDIDEGYATRLKSAFLRCKGLLAAILTHHNRFEVVNGRRYPIWLVNRYGSDASAIMILAICKYLEINTDEELEKMAALLGDGICEMQVVHDSNHFGAFLSWIDTWHAWGNAQVQALSVLGRRPGNEDYISRSRLEADNYFMRLLTYGYLNEWKLSDERHEVVFPQISYGIRCMALGFLNLYETTGDSVYAICSGLTGSWLLGNNAANALMYDRESGRCNDGIVDSTSINQNAGAESTIEALMTLVALQRHAFASMFLFSNSMKGTRTINNEGGRFAYRIYESNDSRIGIVHDIDENTFHVYRDAELHDFLSQFPSGTMATVVKN